MFAPNVRLQRRGLRRFLRRPKRALSAITPAPAPRAPDALPAESAAAPHDPRPIALRDGRAFRAELFAVVEAEMAKLTDASAVDEWHRKVLDPRIAAEVEQEVCRIEMAALERHTSLMGDQVATRAEIVQLLVLERDTDGALERARQAVGLAQARLEERRTGIQAVSVDSVVHAYGEGEVARLCDDLDSHRQSIARVLRGMGARSEQELASLAKAAEQRAADVDRRIAEQEQLLARAEAEVKAAHDRYRGADPTDEQAPPVQTEQGGTPEPPPAPQLGQRGPATEIDLGAGA